MNRDISSNRLVECSHGPAGNIQTMAADSRGVGVRLVWISEVALAPTCCPIFCWRYWGGLARTWSGSLLLSLCGFVALGERKRDSGRTVHVVYLISTWHHLPHEHLDGGFNFLKFAPLGVIPLNSSQGAVGPKVHPHLRLTNIANLVGHDRT